MDAGILPVKRLVDAKQRLSPAFSPQERVRIARALFEDALELCTTVDFLTWLVVSDDEDVLDTAGRRGLQALRDPGRGLNVALAAALDAAQRLGAESATTVPCDVPLAWRGDLVDLLDTGATSDVVLVPAERDGGTNALYLSPPDLVAPLFGPRSLARHIEIAAQHEYRCALLSLPRLALDIDTAEDVRAFLGRPQPSPGRTYEVLKELGDRLPD